MSAARPSGRARPQSAAAANEPDDESWGPRWTSESATAVVQRSSRILAPAVARPQTAAESRILAPAFNWRSRPSTSLPEACCSLCVMIKQQFPSFQF